MDTMRTVEALLAQGRVIEPLSAFRERAWIRDERLYELSLIHI